MLATKLDFLRLSHIRRTGESSSPWQGLHCGLLPRSCDGFDLPVLHQMDMEDREGPRMDEKKNPFGATRGGESDSREAG